MIWLIQAEGIVVAGLLVVVVLAVNDVPDQNLVVEKG